MLNAQKNMLLKKNQQKKMINCHFVALLSHILVVSYASIAGVTYMDNFDFEQRYENINECNPFYWYPLQLPDHCAEIFETAIRSRFKSNIPIRLMKEQKEKNIKISSPYSISSAYGAEVFQGPISTEISYYGHPFSKMLELLSRDVEDHPRAPTVGFLPNVGLVALYQQPISRKSEKMIKKVASIYTPNVPSEYNKLPYSPHSMNMQWSKDKFWRQNDIIKVKAKKSKKTTKSNKEKI